MCRVIAAVVFVGSLLAAGQASTRAVQAPNPVAAAAAERQLSEAHELHQRLLAKPVAQRTEQDYEHIVSILGTVWQQSPGVGAESARYEAAGIYLAMAMDLHVDAGYAKAAQTYLELLHSNPYTTFRRNAEWALTQIQVFHLDQPKEAQTWLTDFVVRYPADDRVALAQRELRGEKVPEPPYLPAADDDVAANSAPPQSPPSVKPPPAQPPTKPSDAAPANQSAGNAAQHQTVVPPQAGAATAAKPVVSKDDPPKAESDLAVNIDAVTTIRVYSNADSTSVVIGLHGQSDFIRGTVPETHRVYFDITDPSAPHNGEGMKARSVPIGDGRVNEVLVAENRPGVVRVVITTAPGHIVADAGQFFPNPARLIVAFTGASYAPLGTGLAEKKPPVAPPVVNTSPPTAGKLDGDSTADAKPPAAPPATVTKPSNPAANSTNPPATIATNNSAASSKPEVGPPAKPAGPASNGAAAAANLGAPVGPPVVHSNPPATPPPSTFSTEAAVNGTESSLNRNGTRTLSRVLDLKVNRVVVDAGHGGRDTGTWGVGGIYEKSVTLDVAQRLGRLLEKQLGVDVVYTRDDDSLVTLQQRVDIANNSRADLFISIHCNYDPDPSVRGVETYYLDISGSKSATAVAARENAGSDRTLHDLPDLLRAVAVNDKKDESHELAADIQRKLVQSTKEDNRGVKAAPFVVLIGTGVPAVLAEVTFLSNKTDAGLAGEESYRQQLAEALFQGIQAYDESLGGIKPASAPAASTPKASNEAHAGGN